MKFAKIIILTSIAFMTIANVFAQSKAQKIDSLLKRYHEYGQFNGSILVADNGKVVYKKGFGMADFEWNIPNQTDTKFRIASITKQFTAALVLQLIEEGKLKLDGKITDYLTDYRKDTGEKITVRHLLNHTSGIPNYSEISRNPYDNIFDFVKKYASGDLEFEPGAKYSYSNSGYSILGAIIEKVTGRSFETALRERIFNPLGMTNSGYDHSATILPKRANGYEKIIGGYVNAPYLDMTIPYAAGSIYSTVEDLFKWDQSLYEDKILSAESKKLMLAPGLGNYGYGIRITNENVGKTDQKTKIAWHGGGINGFNSLIWRAVDKRQTVIILDNTSQGRIHPQIANSIIGILNGQPIEQPKQSIVATLYKLAIEKDVASAVAEYRRLKTENSPTYDFSENELQTLGYELWRMKRLKDAIEIFKLNTETFPASSTGYDTLGEAYLADNQRDSALANYRKAVELDPANANALRIVRQIEGKETKTESSGFAAYVGEYQVTPKLTLTVTVEDGKLFGQLSGQPKLVIEAVSETQFTMPEVKANITFEKDSVGKVTGLILSQGTRTVKAPKIK